MITGEQEAGLSFLGGTHGLDPEWGPFAVQDIGGGSTEFVVGGAPGIAERAISTRMGSVRMTERHVRHDPPTAEDLASSRPTWSRCSRRSTPPWRSATRARSSPSRARRPPCRPSRSSLDRYDPDRIHRTWLTREQAERVRDALAAMTDAERAALPVMAPGRGDVIVAGAVILVATMRRFGVDRVLVSETDILDGLALEMLGG